MFNDFNLYRSGKQNVGNILTYILQLAWHQTEHTLRGLHCGREYHIYVILNNAMGASPASKVFETKFSLKYIEDARILPVIILITLEINYPLFLGINLSNPWKPTNWAH